MSQLNIPPKCTQYISDLKPLLLKNVTSFVLLANYISLDSFYQWELFLSISSDYDFRYLPKNPSQPSGRTSAVSLVILNYGPTMLHFSKSHL